MSVLIEFSMFPLDRGESVSAEVSTILEMIRKSGYEYKLTAMGTIVETAEIKQALQLVEKAYLTLDRQQCHRVFASIKMDIRKDRSNRLTEKIASVENRIGTVKQ